MNTVYSVHVEKKKKITANSDLQVSNGVAFSQLYLEHLQSTDVGSQSGQALLTTATHANKQGIASRRL